MADTAAQADIRGINIDKLAKGFADEDIIFKKFVTVSPTSAREIRWYKKNAGFLSGTSSSRIENVSALARPFIVEQAWTRETSYVRKYFVESPIISSEDIRDSDPDILAGNVRDLTRAIAYKVDERIWDVMTESRSATNINQVHCASGVWNTGTGPDPIKDILDAKQLIRTYGYNPEGAQLFINSESHKELLNWIITTKGANIPQFASGKMEGGVVMRILGLNVVISENVTSKFGLVAQGKRACTWKTFVPITARSIEEVGIGTKIRVWEEGEAILTDPKACCLLSGCGSVYGA